MGLDMYLSRKIQMPQTEVNIPDAPTKDLMMAGSILFTDPVVYVTQLVMYWRKDNHIHNWFVENVQDDQDDCKDYYCSIDHLKHLLSLINTVLNTPYVASEVLPTKEGFFFGGTEYDQYYFESLKTTKAGLELIIEAHQPNYTYEYSSSW